MAASLAQMQTRLRDTIRRFAPERLARQDAAESRAATLYWLSFLVRQLDEEIIDELTPEYLDPASRHSRRRNALPWREWSGTCAPTLPRFARRSRHCAPQEAVHEEPFRGFAFAGRKIR